MTLQQWLGAGSVVKYPYPAKLGEIVSGPADWDTSMGVLDATSSLTVDMDGGPALASDATVGTSSDITNANAFIIGSEANGWEVCQFATATYSGIVGGKPRYVLTNLQRGLRGSMIYASGHIAGQQFLVLDAAAVRATVSPLRINQVHTYEIIYGDMAAGVISFPFTVGSTSARPLPPVNLDGYIKPTSHWVITWQMAGQFPGTLGPPAGFAGSVKWKMEIMDGVTVKRTIYTTSTSYVCVYLAADQITDWGSVQSSVTVKVYQSSGLIDSSSTEIYSQPAIGTFP
jgi:hypothetical protein